ncbi:VIT1/CCC1 transporter family protein [Actibacterium sp.]|uniref:VIT1/CCC1 transporter family protein n=1 Tax=Actibacterium sp. TaxID=1872125 RepID=UPI0035681C2A
MAKSPLGRIQDHLKQIVYGGNDGIVTTFAIVAGFAGAQADGVAQVGGVAVILFGLANLFSDAVSMGLGDFLSSRSQDQMFAQRQRWVLSHIQSDPDSALSEIIVQLELRGMAPDAAARAAREIMTSPQATAELLIGNNGKSTRKQDHPALSGLVTFASFVGFGVLPLLPYLLAEAGPFSLALSCFATLTALFMLGLLRGVATGEPISRSVLETISVGSICAAVAFVVGLLVSA